MDNISLVISELRALRDSIDSLKDEVNDLNVSSSERLTKLETHMTAILGDGKPGRLDSAESDIQTLKQWRWNLAGIHTAISVVVSGIGWLLKH